MEILTISRDFRGFRKCVGLLGCLEEHTALLWIPQLVLGEGKGREGKKRGREDPTQVLKQIDACADGHMNKTLLLLTRVYLPCC